MSFEYVNMHTAIVHLREVGEVGASFTLCGMWSKGFPTLSQIHAWQRPCKRCEHIKDAKHYHADEKQGQQL